MNINFHYQLTRFQIRLGLSTIYGTVAFGNTIYNNFQLAIIYSVYAEDVGLDSSP